jgi:hypothetical protein
LTTDPRVQAAGAQGLTVLRLPGVFIMSEEQAQIYLETEKMKMETEKIKAEKMESDENKAKRAHELEKMMKTHELEKMMKEQEVKDKESQRQEKVN